MTAPFARTQARSTCVGVAPNRLAALATGASIGPPGNRVIGLLAGNKCTKVSARQLGSWVFVRKAAISLDYYPVFCAILEGFFVLRKVVGMELYLRKRIELSGGGSTYFIGGVDCTRTWLTAGRILAVLTIFCKFSTVKLLTPILLI